MKKKIETTTTFNRLEFPTHLFDIPELDFSQDLFEKPLSGQWFRLGALTAIRRSGASRIEDVLSRQSLLLIPSTLGDILGKLDAVGNVLYDLGKSQATVIEDGGKKEYQFNPFHQFRFPFSSVTAEPLAFTRTAVSERKFFINPDLILFFDLEEKIPGSGIWWDPRLSSEALRHHKIDHNLEIVEIRVDYLLKYLKVRQRSLIIGHYRHLYLFDPPTAAIEKFVKEDVTVIAPGAKAIFDNWGLRRDDGPPPFLMRRLHLWIEIKPPAIDIEDPWADEPPFDPYTFTLPTKVGFVAPARFKHFRSKHERVFEGQECGFTDRVYFRQDVLSKYESNSGFDVGDNGSVSCRHYWSISRSIERLGNDLLATCIGDFAQEVPFEEWLHWQQYAVEPPGHETILVLRREQTVPEAVNRVVEALKTLNNAFLSFAGSLRIVAEPAWEGTLDSLAGRQLKWVYLASAGEDEFLKRATLASTLFLDGLESASLRKLLTSIEKNLHLNDENLPLPLGSRNLLQRVALISVLAKTFHPDISKISILVKQSEGKENNTDPDLQAELENSYKLVRRELTPLAFLYDLRTHGGLAHPPNKQKVASAVTLLGLPEKDWHRNDFLSLLNLVTGSIQKITNHLNMAAEIIAARRFSDPE